MLLDGRPEPGRPSGGQRAEGLRDLAALLRLMERVHEARAVEAEAHVLERPTQEELERLSTWMSETRERLASMAAPPRVRLASSPANQNQGGQHSIRAEIEDPTGIRSLCVLQDGVPLLLSLDDDEWTLDPSGALGTLEMLVTLPEDQDVTVISVAAENLGREKSEYFSILVVAL